MYAEFKATRKEDHTRVDLALFTHDFEATTIFIECKGVGGLTKDLAAVEKQLRDYNRDHTALFNLITDGRHWRFYYSFTSGEFKDKLFCKLDLLVDDLEEVAAYFDTFLRRDNIINHGARYKAEAYLTLGKKERAMQDVLPDAQKLVSQPPFPSLPEAMVQLLAAKILTISVGEAQAFLLGNALRPASPPATKPQVTPLTPLPPAQAQSIPPTPIASAESVPVALATSENTFIFQRPKAGFRAVAHWLPTGAMRVLAGSTIATDPTSSFSNTNHKLRQYLLATGIIRLHLGSVCFTQDYEFASPNQAAVLVCGGAVNARVAWLREDTQQSLGSYVAEHAVPV